MNRQVMQSTCEDLIDRFDQLEALLAHVPKKKHAAVFRGVQEAKELWNIAVYETAGRATSEQVAHLQSLAELSEKILKRIPQKLRDSLGDDDDDD